MSRLLMVGLSHKSAPLELREALALDEAGLDRAYAALRQGGIRELVLLSTCNRVEAWAACDDEDAAEADLRAWMEGLKPGHGSAVRKALGTLHSEHALWHLLKVAASLDSMVLGEAQILGQVKQAYEQSVARGASGSLFHGLFQKAFAAAKEVRTRTELGRHPASVPSVAVQVAQRIYSSLEGKKVLILGAGEVAELCAEYFKSAGVREMAVCNRTLAKAKALAKKVGGRAEALEALEAELPRADIVVSSVSGRERLVGREAAAAALHARGGAPQLYLDLGVPRNIDPEVRELESVYLYAVDDLQGLAEEHRERRLEASREAEAILKKHLASIKEWMASSRLAPAIKALTARVEAQRREEWERLAPKLKHLSPEDLEKAEYLSKSLARKILDAPIRRLKDSVKGGKAALHLEALNDLFELKAGD